MLSFIKRGLINRLYYSVAASVVAMVGSIFFIFVPAFAHAATYYVDNSCTYNGTGLAQTCAASAGAAGPFNSIANVASAVTGNQAGNSVLLKSGDTFREEYNVAAYGASSSPFTIGAYGTGTPPVVSGSNVLSSWTATSSISPIYNWTSETSGFNLNATSYTYTIANASGTTVSSGTVSQANIRLSVATGTAFVDFSASSTLTPYLGDLLTITDGSSHQITGYIKAAGTGETYGSELLPNPSLNTTSSINVFYDSTIASVAGGYIGNALQITTTGANGNSGQYFNASLGMLIRNSAYLKQGTEANYEFFESEDSSFSGLNTTYALPSSWTQEVMYSTADNSAGYMEQVYGGGTSGKTSLFNDASAKQVLTPSTTGVTITSATSSPIVYYASYPTSTPPSQVFEDGTRLIQNTTSSASLTAGQWYLDTTNGRIWVYTTAGDNPSGHTIEMSVRSYPIDISGDSYVTINGLTITESNIQGIGIFGGSNYVNILNSTISYAYLNGIEVWNNTLPANSSGTIQNNTISYSGGDGIELSLNSTNWTVENNVVYDNSQLTASNLYTAGIDVNSSSTSNNTVEYNKVYSNGLGQSTNIGFGIHVDDQSLNNIIRWNDSYGNNDCNILEEISENNQIYGNLVYGSVQGCGIGIRGTSSTPASGNVVYDNTIYGNLAVQTWAGGLLAYGDGNPGSFVNNIFKNNISVGNGSPQLNAFGGAQNDGTDGYGNVYTYNDFGAASSNFIKWGSSNYSTYSSWETATGSCGTIGCSHSVQSNPIFVSTSTSNFALASSSPTIDAGLNLGSTYDMGLDPASTWPSSILLDNQNTYGSGWDMGAYVYTQTAKPSIVMTAPTASSTVSGLTIISASSTAVSPSSISSVQFYLDGSPLGSPVTSTSSPNVYSYSWNTASSTAGSHTLYALATDNYGNTATSTNDPITVVLISSPTFSTSTATSVGTSTAILNGTITSTGNATATIEGFNYGTSTAYGLVASTTGSFATGTYSQSISGLVPNTLYHFQAFATNNAGTGTSTDVSFTTASAATTSTPPQSLSATPGNAQVALSWSAPASNGGASITQYDIWDKLTASSTYSEFATSTASQTTSTVTSLVNGASYSFEVFAENSVGSSTASNVVSSTPALPIAILQITTSTSLNFSAVNSSTATSSQFITITNIGPASSTLIWSGSSNSSWATLTPSSGSLGSNASTSILLMVNPTGLAIGTYNATITITAGGATGSPQVLPMSLLISSSSISDAILSPTNGSTVTSTITISASATATVGIASVQFLVDGSHFVTVTSTPYNVSWDTTQVPNGSHTISVIATDVIGDTTSTAISVMVSNIINQPVPSVTTVEVAAGGVTKSSSPISPPLKVAPSSSSPQLQLAMLVTELESLESQATIGGKASNVFPRNLSLSMTGNDVAQLQQYLIEQDKGSAAKKLRLHGVTKTFGMLTYNALVEFQKSVGITPASGFFGPKTRAFLEGK